MKLFLADFNVEILAGGFSIKRTILKDYIACFDTTDLLIEISDKNIDFELALANKDGISEGCLYSTAVLRKLAEWLPLHNAFVFHSAVFDVEGTGIALAAHSGTGKTTHMLLWQKLLGQKMTIVNGDKPIIRFFDDEPETPYAYGTPWNGKEHLGCNMRTPLKVIAFIERAENNSCERMSMSDAVNLIFNQVYMPKDPAAAAKTIELINRLISCCELWKISCNMELEAAEVAYNRIMEEKNETKI